MSQETNRKEEAPNAFFVEDIDEFVRKNPGTGLRALDGEATEEELLALETSGEIRRFRREADVEISIQEEIRVVRERRTDEVIRRRVG